MAPSRKTIWNFASLTVVALICTGGIVLGLSAVATATSDPVTLYLSNNTAADPGCISISSLAPSGGSLEASPPAVSMIGSPSPQIQYCTSTAAAYAGPTITVTSVSVTLYVGTSNGFIIYLNGSSLSQGGGALAISGPQTGIFWSTTTCTALTFSIPVLGGATLSAGDVQLALAFAQQGSPSTGGQATTCSGVGTPSSVTISGSSGTTSTTSTSTSSSGGGGGGGTPTCTSDSHSIYYLDLNHGPNAIPGPILTSLTGSFFLNTKVFVVSTFNWSLASGSSGTGIGGAGLVHQPPFNLTMASTLESPLILGAADRGTTFPHIYFYVLGMYNHGGGANGPGRCIFMKFDLTNAVISQYSVGGTDPMGPVDQLSISFQSMTMSNPSYSASVS